MSALALGLILIAAFTHATWNLAAKRSGGGLPFVWLAGLMSLACYAPVVTGYWLWRHPVLPADAWLVILGSGLLKTGYALLLQRGYRHGDFSLVYPLARGTGPLLSTLAAIVIFGERPTPLALAGGLVIVASVFALTGGFDQVERTLPPPPRLRRTGPVSRITHPEPASPAASRGSAGTPRPTAGIFYGITCGCCIAGYTVWDQRAVSHLALPPVLYDCGTQLVMCAVIAPFAWRRRAEVARDWREHRGKALTVAVLGPLSYVLILTAMRFTPVSYLAPAREISILIGTLLGAKLLRETDAPRRLLAATGMVVGVIALALG